MLAGIGGVGTDVDVVGDLVAVAVAVAAVTRAAVTRAAVTRAAVAAGRRLEPEHEVAAGQRQDQAQDQDQAPARARARARAPVHGRLRTRRG
ncbi:MAG: hypothetical protein HS111_01785 [Kofleriaceae bacterium]|nr:hypothetical protein [Kofleriaceae bacterium]